MDQKYADNQWLVIGLVGGLVFLFFMLPLFVTAQEDLPPRNTPTVTAMPTVTASPTMTPTPITADTSSPHTPGARLQFHVQYGDNWAWHLWAWQDLWTEVEWTDGTDWFAVEGWRGNLDSIEQSAAGGWVSVKEWWVGPEDLNSGPFRWVIYQQEGGERLVVSEPFTLPAHSGALTVVNQTIGE